MKELQILYDDFDSGRISLERTKNRLLEIVFQRKKEFGISMGDDEFQGFLIHLEEKLVPAIRNYSREVADFRTYFFGVISTTAFWYRRKLENDRRINSSYEFLAVQEDFNEEFYDKLFEENASISELEIFIDKELQPKKIPEANGKKIMPHRIQPFRATNSASEKIGKKISATKEDEESFREMCLVLAVKSCCSVDDMMVSKICRFTGISREKMDALLFQAKDSLKKKERRLEDFSTRRNCAYFRRKRLSYIREQAKAEEKSVSPEFEKKISDLDRRWKKTNLVIQEARKRMIPSNVSVGKILSMSPKKVSRLVMQAREMSEKIKRESGSVTYRL